MRKPFSWNAHDFVHTILFTAIATKTNGDLSSSVVKKKRQIQGSKVLGSGHGRKQWRPRFTMLKNQQTLKFVKTENL